jgi:uncharacterized protein (UPF0335 family)
MNKEDLTDDSAVEQPTEQGELREVVRDFIKRLRSIDQEIELLKEDRKRLFDDYSRKLDMKTLKAALQVAKIKEKVNHKDTFESFVDILDEV